MAHAKFGMAAQHRAVAHLLGHGYFETRYGNDPSMELQATFVGFVDGKGQWVIAWIGTVLPRKANVPGLDLRRINDRSADARLQKYGIDIGSLELVEQLAQFLLLKLAGKMRCGTSARPIEAIQSRDPHGAQLMLGSSLPQHGHGIFCNCHARQQQE